MLDTSNKPEKGLADLQRLCATLIAKNKELDALNEKIKELSAEINTLSQDLIPSTMEELNLEKIVLNTGETISTKMDVNVSINKEQAQNAYHWLDMHGLGNIIKTDVKAAFHREERGQALKLLDEMISNGYDAYLDEKIHPQTLKAFVKEQLQAGTELPPDYFNINPYYKTVVKPPKQAK